MDSNSVDFDTNPVGTTPVDSDSNSVDLDIKLEMNLQKGFVNQLLKEHKKAEEQNKEIDPGELSGTTVIAP